MTYPIAIGASTTSQR